MVDELAEHQCLVLVQQQLIDRLRKRSQFRSRQTAIGHQQIRVTTRTSKSHNLCEDPHVPTLVVRVCGELRDRSLTCYFIEGRFLIRQRHRDCHFDSWRQFAEHLRFGSSQQKGLHQSFQLLASFAVVVPFDRNRETLVILFH